MGFMINGNHDNAIGNHCVASNFYLTATCANVALFSYVNKIPKGQFTAFFSEVPSSQMSIIVKLPMLQFLPFEILVWSLGRIV